MKLSIITVCYNAEQTIEDTIKSVINQNLQDIEYIIIDGGSTDSTLSIIQNYAESISQIVSEQDNGLYDAINKGIKLASGDVVGLIHADDIYIDANSLREVAETFHKHETDSVIADLIIVSPTDNQKIRRYYRGRNFKPGLFRYGIMPPHPTFFVKRHCFEKFGLYKTHYRIAADFELMMRFLLVHKICYHYIPKTLISMRVGGTSTSGIKSSLLINKEVLQACRENNIRTNYLRICVKYFYKLSQFILRSK